MRNWIEKNFKSKNHFYIFLLAKIGMIALIVWMATACCPNSCKAQEVKYDINQRWVTDNENLFTPEQEKELNQMIADYEAKTTCEIAILTTDNYEESGDILNYAFEVGDKWGVGKKDIDNGLVIIISKANDNETAVATGYGIEGYLTDAWTKSTQNSLLKPYCDKGEYFEGTKLFLLACFEQIGDTYSSDENTKKKGESYVYQVWEWFKGIPWYWKVIVAALYVGLWIFDPTLAWYITILILTLGRSSGGKFGGGKFGGGGSRG